MYVPERYGSARGFDALGVIGAHPFATVFVVADGEFEAAHLPLVLETGGPGTRLLGHCSARNPLLRLTERPGARALAVFTGPHGYLSPADYRSDGGLPTWNYIAVHAEGGVEPLDEGEEGRQLAGLAAAGEALRGAADPWTPDRAPAGLVAELLPHIRFFRITATRVQAAYKLSQGRGPDDIRAQVQALRRRPSGASRDLADAMEAVHGDGAPPGASGQAEQDGARGRGR